MSVVRDGHPLAGTRVTLDQFCRFPHVTVSTTDSEFTGPVDQALAQLGRERQIVLSVPGFLILPAVLATDDLIAVVPERVVQGRLGGLRTFTSPVAIPEFNVVALWHHHLRPPLAQRVRYRNSP